MKARSSDDFQTLAYAIEPLLQFLGKDWVIWECVAGKGNLVGALKAHGYKVIATDISEGKDFLSYEPPEYNAIVTNPPYSLKNRFLQRAYSLGKPFAFLLPLTFLESQFRQNLFRQHGISLLLLDKRINFETPSGRGSGSWFATAWFCWKILPSDLVFSSFGGGVGDR